MQRMVLVFGALSIALGAACSGSGTSGAPSPAASPTGPPPDATVDMLTTRLVYRPAIVSIKAGDTVLWRNVDAAPHSVTSKTDAWRDPGTINKGGTFSYTFPTPGTFEYRCVIHPAMTGKVIVA